MRILRRLASAQLQHWRRLRNAGYLTRITIGGQSRYHWGLYKANISHHDLNSTPFHSLPVGQVSAQVEVWTDQRTYFCGQVTFVVQPEKEDPAKLRRDEEFVATCRKRAAGLKPGDNNYCSARATLAVQLAKLAEARLNFSGATAEQVIPLLEEAERLLPGIASAPKPQYRSRDSWLKYRSGHHWSALSALFRVHVQLGRAASMRKAHQLLAQMDKLYPAQVNPDTYES